MTFWQLLLEPEETASRYWLFLLQMFCDDDERIQPKRISRTAIELATEKSSKTFKWDEKSRKTFINQSQLMTGESKRNIKANKPHKNQTFDQKPGPTRGVAPSDRAHPRKYYFVFVWSESHMADFPAIALCADTQKLFILATNNGLLCNGWDGVFITVIGNISSWRRDQNLKFQPNVCL